MCMLVYTDSALHNADANTEEGSDDELLAKAKQKGIRVRSRHGDLVCVAAQARTILRKQKPFQFLSRPGRAKPRNEQSCLLLVPKPVPVETRLTWQYMHEQCCVKY